MEIPTPPLHSWTFPFFMKEGVDDEHSESDGVVVIYKFFPQSQPHQQFKPFHNYLPLVRSRSRGYSFFHKEGECPICCRLRRHINCTLHSANCKLTYPHLPADAVLLRGRRTLFRHRTGNKCVGGADGIPLPGEGPRHQDGQNSPREFRVGCYPTVATVTIFILLH